MVRFTETEDRFPGAGWRGDRESLFNGDRVSVWGDGTSSGDGWLVRASEQCERTQGP